MYVPLISFSVRGQASCAAGGAAAAAAQPGAGKRTCVLNCWSQVCNPAAQVAVLPPPREPAVLPPPRHSLVQRIRETWEARLAQQVRSALC